MYVCEGGWGREMGRKHHDFVSFYLGYSELLKFIRKFKSFRFRWFFSPCLSSVLEITQFSFFMFSLSLIYSEIHKQTLICMDNNNGLGKNQICLAGTRLGTRLGSRVKGYGWDWPGLYWTED